MRAILCILLILLATATGAAFYFGLCTIAAERQDRAYVLRFVVHPDILVPKVVDESAQKNHGDSSLEARGKIVRVDPAKSEFVLTESFRNRTFRVAKDTLVLINGQAAKLADLKGGDAAAVTYVRQGQQLNASLVRCTRRLATP